MIGFRHAAVVFAFSDFLDDFADKSVEVVWIARCDDTVLTRHLFTAPDRPGIDQIGFD